MQIDRFQVAAIVDRLIFGSAETFSRDDALALLALIPPELLRRSLSDWFQIAAKGEMSSGAMSGAAAGVGNVKMPTESSAFELDSGGRRILRAGQWKIRPTRGRIEIEQVMASDTDEGRSALLRFEGGEPVALDILAQREVSLGFLTIRFGSYQPWKRPERAT